jgi:4-amino-4-deoxy-L-arabinose transferase-like glycosyltransferase
MADHRNKHRDKKPPAGAKPVSGKTDPLLRNLQNFVTEEIEIAAATPARAAPRDRAPPRWLPAFKLGVAATGLWLIAVLAGLATRVAWPGDETRWLAIAWEMWARGDLLVPRLNGAVQSVAPLFLWCLQLGWLVFGEVEWWARLVPALFMLGSLFLAARMARFLWPGQERLVRHLPLVLLGGFYWAWSATLLSPDPLMLFFTLAALVALLWMWRTRDLRVWLLLGLTLGLGLLASGGLIFLYVLPIALIAPLWTRGTPVMPWGYWYADIFKASLMGLVIFAAWAVPVGLRAGGAAIAPLFTAPLASHTLALFPNVSPWWWYLFLLPWLAFPWSLWPLPWLRLWHIRRQPIGNGLAFCMWWATVTIALFSLFAPRQPQLLLPLVPAFFLAAGWLLLDERHSTHDPSRLASTMIFPLMLLGALLAILPGLPHVAYLPEFLWQQSPFVGVAVLGLGVAVGWLPIPSLEARIANMAVTVVVITTLGLLALGWQYNASFELSGAAQAIAGAQRQGQAVAHVGAYDGQFHFAGQLHQPLEVLTPAQAEAWPAAHPDGLLVTYTNAWQPRLPPGAKPLYEQPYGDGQLRIWPAAVLKGE